MTAPSETAEPIRRRVAELLGTEPDQIDLDQRITDLSGMDSVKLIEVVAWCEKRWGVDLDEDALFDVRDGNDLCLLVADAVAAKAGRA